MSRPSKFSKVKELDQRTIGLIVYGPVQEKRLPAISDEELQMMRVNSIELNTAMREEAH